MNQSRVRLRYDHERLIIQSIPLKQVGISLCSLVLALSAGSHLPYGPQAANAIESAAEGIHEERIVLPDPGNNVNSTSGAQADLF